MHSSAMGRGVDAADGQPRARRWLAPSIIVLAFVLTACGGGGGGGGDGGGGGTAVTLSADVYPLATGDRRSWRVVGGAQDGSVRSERVGAPITLNGNPAFPVLGDDGPGDYLQRSATGIAVQPGPGSDELTQALGSFDLVRFGAVAGRTELLLSKSVSADIDGDGRADSADVRLESTFIGYENVTTAAGNFTGAARVRLVVTMAVRPGGSGTTVNLVVSTEEWLAPQVGPVRSVVTTSGSGIATTSETEEVFAFGVGTRRSESVAPALVGTSPQADAYAPASAQVSITFSEAIDPLTVDGSGGLSLVDSAGSAVAVTRSASSGGTRWTLSPLAPLPDGRYEIRTSSAVTDLANNPLPVSTQAFTVDTRGPRLVSTTPAQNADDAAATGQLKFTFDEPVLAAPGSTPSILLYEGSSSGPRQVLPAVIQGRELIATLATPLLRNHVYVMEPGLALSDGAGNAFGGQAFSILFTTDTGTLSRPAALVDNVAVSALAAGDINGDGRPDVVLAGQVIGGTDIFLGARLRQADGSLAPAVALRVAGSYCAPAVMALADFNGDGRADLALTGCRNAPLTVLMQQGDGSFAAESAAADGSTFTVVAVDLEGDGSSELVTTAAFDTFQVLRRTPGGTWTVAASLGSGPSSTILDWRSADINGDGKPDLVWLRVPNGGGSYELAWALRTSLGYGAVSSRPVDTFTGNDVALSLGDVSGDGRIDAIVTRGGNASVPSLLRVLKQNAGGGFDAPVDYASPVTASTALIGDIDGDGRSDVIVLPAGDVRFAVYLQAADGTLEAARSFVTGYGYYGGPSAALLTDVNADGLPDLVALKSIMFRRPSTGAWPLRATTQARR